MVTALITKLIDLRLVRLSQERVYYDEKAVIVEKRFREKLSSMSMMINQL
jgi:hypothetical protein